MSNLKSGAKPGNQHAAKDDADKASSYIHARCLQIDKANWEAAADREGLNLTKWMIKTLNAAIHED